MKQLFGVFMVLVVGIMLIPIVTESADEYDITSNTDTQIAVGDDATPEDVILTETPEEITAVKVNDVALDVADYSLTGNTVTIVATASVADDTIDVFYTYQMDVGTGQGALIGLLPLVFVILIVSGVIYTIKFKN